MRCSLRGILFGIATLFFLLNLTIGSAQAAPLLDLSNESGCGTVTLPITMTNEPGTDIVATSNDIAYDAEYFSFLDCIIGPAGESANKDVQCSFPAYGVLRVVVTGLNLNPIPNGIIAYLTFSIEVNTPCDSSYEFVEYPSASNAVGALVTVDGSDGGIFIICGDDTDLDGVCDVDDNCDDSPKRTFDGYLHGGGCRGSVLE